MPAARFGASLMIEGELQIDEWATGVLSRADRHEIRSRSPLCQRIRGWGSRLGVMELVALRQAHVQIFTWIRQHESARPSLVDVIEAGSPIFRRRNAVVRSLSRLLFVLSWLVAASLGTPGMAQESVVAKVNGRDITEADLRLAEAEIGNDLGTIPADQRRRVLVEYLIENHLFAEAAENEKLGAGPAFDERLKYWQRRALRDAYFDRSIKSSVTEADARKLYDAQISSAKAQEEVRARHILIETEVKAKEVFEKLAHGDDFSKLAKEFSKDPGSKDEGGDLGYFARGQMVPQFEDAAFKLKKGDVSQPVQSQFGWHIIKVEDRRDRGAPAFDTVKDRILASLVHRKAQEMAQNLRDKAKLEFVDPALKTEADRETQIRPAPADPKR